jgi:hypothetical protein
MIATAGGETAPRWRAHEVAVQPSNNVSGDQDFVSSGGVIPMPANPGPRFVTWQVARDTQTITHIQEKAPR